jgi:hypothetical protein
VNDAKDSFPDDLKRQWLAGRAAQIFDEMHVPFRKFIAERAGHRAAQLYDAADQAPKVPGMPAEVESSTLFTMAWSQAVGEAVLISIALQLAREESRSPPAEDH